MDRLEKIKKLNAMLIEDQPQFAKDAGQFPDDEVNQRKLMRSLMNLRFPDEPMSDEFYKLQDEVLVDETNEKGIVHVPDLETCSSDHRIAIWQGDITRLDADAIVNAANSQMIGCFIPCHGCIDNAIHSAAGLQLKDECIRLMREQKHEEETGVAKITKAYNLPAKRIIHTVGPIVRDKVTPEDEAALASCYKMCMQMAEYEGLKSIAFCCISTGEFNFPNQRAAEIAVETVKKCFEEGSPLKKVVFNVFKDEDLEIYKALLD